MRLSEKLYNAIAAWAEDDFRSVNGQIEYLLTECVRQRKKNGNCKENIVVMNGKKYEFLLEQRHLLTLFCVIIENMKDEKEQEKKVG